jgi:hypothetical protein
MSNSNKYIPKDVGIRKALETRINPATEEKQDDIIAELDALNSLVPSAYDYIELSYTDGNITGVVFKTGGSGGSTVSTLTLTYDVSDNLETVTKT